MAKSTLPARTAWTIRINSEVLDAARVCAASTGSSLNAFLVNAIASTVRGWQNPATGRRMIQEIEDRWDELSGWVCEHGHHKGAVVDARDCEWKYDPGVRKSWSHMIEIEYFDNVVDEEVVKRLNSSKARKR
jgi:hypothetical protein